MKIIILGTYIYIGLCFNHHLNLYNLSEITVSITFIENIDNSRAAKVFPDVLKFFSAEAFEVKAIIDNVSGF